MILKSAAGARLSVSVAVLLALLGSVMPGGAAMLAVFDKVPKALGATCAVSVKVAVPPTTRSTVALMLPAPFADPQLDPLEAEQVQVALVSVAGRLSATMAPEIALGPLLLATMV